MNLKFLGATDWDIQLLYKIEIETFIRDFDNTFPTIEEFKEFLKGSTNYLIYFNDTPVGSYMLTKTENKDEGEILGITILPEYQGRGIGTITLKKILNDLKSKYKKIKRLILKILLQKDFMKNLDLNSANKKKIIMEMDSLD